MENGWHIHGTSLVLDGKLMGNGRNEWEMDGNMEHGWNGQCMEWDRMDGKRWKLNARLLGKD